MLSAKYLPYCSVLTVFNISWVTAISIHNTLLLGMRLRCLRLILGLRPANERRRYFVTTSLIGWVQA